MLYPRSRSAAIQTLVVSLVLSIIALVAIMFLALRSGLIPDEVVRAECAR